MTPSRKRLISAATLLVLPLAAALTGCGGEVNVPNPPGSQPVSFARDIQPIFNELCIGCHSDGGFASLTGIRMRLTADKSFASLVNQPSSGNSRLTLVYPGSAALSLLYEKVSQNRPPVGQTMPLIGRRLNGTELAQLRDWINAGAANN